MTINNKGKILIVGGAGYIGSHVVLYLLENQSQEIVVLDDLSTGSRDAVLTKHFYQGDLGDRALLQRIFSEHHIIGVMHFAAFILVEESVKNPMKYYQNNVVKTLTLLDEMIKHKVHYFIFSSTASVYGEPKYTPMDINHPKDPINPYGKSKLMLEQILKDLDTAYGLKYSILRYFNAAGADPHGRIGYHEPTTHLIPQALKAASGRKDFISIFGIDYNTRDGTCIRDYIHVMDIASAHLLAFKKLESDSKSVIYNLGDGKGFSVLEVLESVKKVTKKNFQIIKAEKREGDPAILIADADLAKDELNWQLRFSSLDQIITDAWQWEVKHKWH